MVNFGLNPASLLGIALAIAGAGLYFLRSVRPELSRDHDIFFAAVGLLCGLILLSQGWRLDPILQFSQFLLAGTTIFFAVESVRLRGVATEQAKRSTPIVDDDRPVSRVYRAEIDEYDTFDAEEERPITRRIRGTRDSRSSRDEYDEDLEVRRRPSGSDRLPPSGDRPRKRRPRPENRVTDSFSDEEVRDDFRDDSREDRSERPSRNGGNGGNSVPRSTSPRESTPPAPTKPRRPRPSQSSSPYASSPAPSSTPRRRSNAEPADYVDYQPVDYTPEDERDNSDNFDDKF